MEKWKRGVSAYSFFFSSKKGIDLFYEVLQGIYKNRTSLLVGTRVTHALVLMKVMWCSFPYYII